MNTTNKIQQANVITINCESNSLSNIDYSNLVLTIYDCLILIILIIYYSIYYINWHMSTTLIIE